MEMVLVNVLLLVVLVLKLMLLLLLRLLMLLRLLIRAAGSHCCSHQLRYRRLVGATHR